MFLIYNKTTDRTKNFLLGLKTTALMLGLTVSGIALFTQPPEASAQASSAKPQAMPVTIDIVQTKPVQLWKPFSTRMQAVDFAEIRPQVSGNVTEIHFADGQMVEKDDVLYVIDPRPFQATAQQAKAELASAQNDANYTQKELERAKGLVKTNAISQRIYDERSNRAAIAKMAVAAAKARLEQALINLDRAYVKAPFKGRVSRAEITIGNLVEAGPNAPLLTSIVSNNGIYADFEVDEQTYLTQIRSVAKNKTEESTIPVKLSLSKGSAEYTGFIHSFDNRIDTASGTIRARAYFENRDQALLPGMFGNIQLGSAISQEHILVNEKAIGTNQDRKFVYIVNNENKVTYREVNLGNAVNGQRIIESGLANGDKVITRGIIRVRPGMLVSPQTPVDSRQVSLNTTP